MNGTRNSRIGIFLKKSRILNKNYLNILHLCLVVSFTWLSHNYKQKKDTYCNINPILPNLLSIEKPLLPKCTYIVATGNLTQIFTGFPGAGSQYR